MSGLVKARPIGGLSGNTTTTFLGENDTPNTYAGQAGKVPAVNSAETALEFVTMGGGGGGTPLTDKQVREKSRKSLVFAQDEHSSSMNFNDYITEGLYNVFGNGTYTNPPYYFTYIDGFLEVLYTQTGTGSGGSTTNIEQRYTHYSSTGTQGAYFMKTFKRVRKSGTWQPWFSEPKTLMCAVRNTAGTWGIINDSVHVPTGIVSVIQNDTIGQPNFTLNLQFFKVGSVIIASDEAYAKYGVTVGNSVGSGPTFCYVYKSGMAITVSCNGTSFSAVPSPLALVKNTDFSFSFDAITGYLTITHTSLVFNVEDLVMVTPTDLDYFPIVVSKTTNSTVVKFMDRTNTVQLSLDAKMTFNLHRTGVFQIPNANLGIAVSNFWVLGMNP